MDPGDDFYEPNCNIPEEGGVLTPDEDIEGFLLFADIDPTDEAAIEARKQEWEALSGS